MVLPSSDTTMDEKMLDSPTLPSLSTSPKVASTLGSRAISHASSEPVGCDALPTMDSLRPVILKDVLLKTLSVSNDGSGGLPIETVSISPGSFARKGCSPLAALTNPDHIAEMSRRSVQTQARS